MSRNTIRYGAALVATAMAAIYILIGLDVIQVVDAQPGGTDLFGFGMSAAALFGVGAILLVALDRRPLWAIGAVLQVLVAVMYVAVSVDRSPPFEPWGIALRVLQLPLFAALVYLALRPSSASTPVRSRITPVAR
jgi:hypothetical protein